MSETIKNLVCEHMLPLLLTKKALMVILAGFTVVSLLLLILPLHFEIPRLSEFLSSFGKYIFPVFLLSIVFLGILLLLDIIKFLRQLCSKTKLANELKDLTAPECLILQNLLKNNKERYQKELVSNLISRKILVLAHKTHWTDIDIGKKTVKINPEIKKQVAKLLKN